MAERESSPEPEKDVDLLVIAPSTLDRFIVVATGKNPQDAPSLSIVRGKDVFTKDMILEAAQELHKRNASSMQGFLSNAHQLYCYGALSQIADNMFGKDNWQGNKSARMVFTSSFESFMTEEAHKDSRQAIIDAGLDEELQAMVGDLKIEALIRGSEYEEIVWQNPETVTKQ